MISTDSLYSLGKYKDCQRKLELKLNEQDGKSLRDKIILINNRLACQLKSAASNEELDKIRQDYLLLWKLDAGLPESHDSHVTCSAAVICNLMSCYVRVWLVTGQISLIYEAIDKFKDIRTKINSEDNVIVRKLYLIKKLLKVINEEKDIGQFMINNNDRSCSDVKYYRAHQLYMEGDYSQCVQAINNNRPIDDFMLTLLANCHVKMGHYQLALHYYKQCLSLTTGCLHQLVTRNICTTYQLIDNTTAELSLRDLYVQLLKNSQIASPTNNKLLLYQNITGNITSHVTATDHWMEAAYTAIKRCLTLKEYPKALAQLQELLTEVQHCQFLPPRIPTASGIALLISHIYILSGDNNRAESALDVIPRRAQGMLTMEESLVEILREWLKGCAVKWRNSDEASHVTVTCLKMVDKMLNDPLISNEIKKTLFTIKRMLLNNCAMFAIIGSRLSHALQLLMNCLAITEPTDPAHHKVIYNYCLLLIKMGKLKESCQYWLEEMNRLEITNNMNYNTLTTYCMRLST